uniref:p10 n=1 Tax=Beet black scorch virus TaxID=196375 RepID=A3R4V3_9TOMB|nr:p10 [Beet black scorch virus]
MRQCGLLLLVASYNVHLAFLLVLGPPLLVRVSPTLSCSQELMLLPQGPSQSLVLVCSPATLAGLMGLLLTIANLDGLLSSSSMFPSSLLRLLGQ